MHQSRSTVRLNQRTRRLLAAGAAVLACTAGVAFAAEDMVKKTLDGRCLAPDHPEYWKTNVYVAKPTMEDCLKSGGRRG